MRKFFLLGVPVDDMEEKITRKSIISIGGVKYIDSFECDTRTKSKECIIGRKHIGDENGKTIYKYGSLVLIGEDANYYRLHLGDLQISNSLKECNSYFQCPSDCVIVGRHFSNGETYYSYRKVIISKTKSLKMETCSISVNKESDGSLIEKILSVNDNQEKYYLPMVGRVHNSNATIETTTLFATKFYVDDDLE